jgi:hypothetical protein
VTIAAFGILGFFDDAFVPGLMIKHGGAHEEDATAEGVELVQEGGHIALIGGEGFGVEVFVAAVVHAE